MKNKEKLRIWIRSSCFTLFSFRSHFVLFFPSLLKCSSAYGTELGDRLQRTTLGASLPRWADVLGSTIKEFLGPISDGREYLIGRKSTKTSIFDAEVEEHLHSIGAAIGSCEHSFLMPLYSLIYLYWTALFPRLHAFGTTSVISNFDHRNTRYKQSETMGDLLRYCTVPHTSAERPLQAPQLNSPIRWCNNRGVWGVFRLLYSTKCFDTRPMYEQMTLEYSSCSSWQTWRNFCAGTCLSWYPVMMVNNSILSSAAAHGM